MLRASLSKVIMVIGSSAILVLLVAAPLVAQNTNKSTDKKDSADSASKQNQSSQQTEISSPGTSDSGVHWAAIATDDGTPTVRHASDSSTTVASSSGEPGEYTVTFPTEVDVSACTATINSGAPGMIYCGAGDANGLNPNQLKVQTTDRNNEPAQDSNFTVAAYTGPSSDQGSGESTSKASSGQKKDQKNEDQKNK